MSDDFGHALTRENPQRIVSLAPSVTELIFALGQGERLVGVTNYCDYPTAARSIKRIGGILDLNLEAIVALNPDLVIGTASGATRRQIKALAGLIPGRLAMLRYESTADLFRNIELLSGWLKAGAEGLKLGGELRTYLRPAHQMNGPKLKAVMIVGCNPERAVGRKSYLRELLELGGFANGVQVDRSYVALSREQLSVLQPHVVFVAVNQPHSCRRFEQEVKKLTKAPLIRLAADPFHRLGPRLVEAVQQLQKHSKELRAARHKSR